MGPRSLRRAAILLGVALASTAVWAGSSLAATPRATSVAPDATNPLLGAVPPASTSGFLNAIGANPPAALTYHAGGTVMHSATIYAIYWSPAGTTTSANYQSTISQYLTDVAAASGTTNNVYATLSQYYDVAGGVTRTSPTTSMLEVRSLTRRPIRREVAQFHIRRPHRV